jgi:hypothetical protein
MIRRFAFMLRLFTLLACSFSLGQSAASKLQVFGGYSFENIDRLRSLTADEQIVSHHEVIPGLAFQADQSMQYSLLTP